MVDVKQAIKLAKDYATDILEVDRADLLLEEVKSDDRSWYITLSFKTRTPIQPRPDAFAVMARYFTDREFKSFEVNKDNGAVEKMSNVQAA